MRLEAEFKGFAMNMYNSSFSDELMHLGFPVTKSIQVAVDFKKQMNKNKPQFIAYFGDQLMGAKLILFQHLQYHTQQNRGRKQTTAGCAPAIPAQTHVSHFLYFAPCFLLS